MMFLAVLVYIENIMSIWEYDLVTFHVHNMCKATSRGSDVLRSTFILIYNTASGTVQTEVFIIMVIETAVSYHPVSF